MIGPAIGGLIGGSILILVLNERLHIRSYAYFLLVNVLFFFVFIVTLNTLVSYFFYYRDEIAAAENNLQLALRLLFLDPYAIRNIVTWMIIAFLTLHGLKIYEKYGPGTIVSMFLGRYHRPHEVQRIFMFLDLSDSTTLAEQLGHVKFFSLLRNFYIDITDPILNSKGEIYQYVGDEIIVAWQPSEKLTENQHCLNCFFLIKKTIALRKSFYEHKFGVTPTFKAAIHMGKVVVGETGVIKREIVYSGDILNTTARMLEQCKIHQQGLIISQELVELLPENILTYYQLSSLGEMTLRGKTNQVELFGVKMNKK